MGLFALQHSHQLECEPGSLKAIFAVTWLEIWYVFGCGRAFGVAAPGVAVPFVFVGGRATEPWHEVNFVEEYEKQQPRVVNPD